MIQGMIEDLIPIGDRRSGQKLDGPIRFIVAHDSGNPGATAQANVNYYKNTYDITHARVYLGNPTLERGKIQQSAHIFVDDKDTILCVPLDEKAWHVLYDRAEDNRRYGDDANDVAIGVEYCYGGKISSMIAYWKYVNVLAWLCFLNTLDPRTDISGHCELDPGRKTDPEGSLKLIDKTLTDLREDVKSRMTSFVI